MFSFYRQRESTNQESMIHKLQSSVHQLQEKCKAQEEVGVREWSPFVKLYKGDNQIVSKLYRGDNQIVSLCTVVCFLYLIKLYKGYNQNYTGEIIIVSICTVSNQVIQGSLLNSQVIKGR